MCKHEIEHLMGTADGIVCRKCGAKFASFDEINAASPEPAAEPEAPAAEPAEKPKRTRKSAKKGAD